MLQASRFPYHNRNTCLFLIDRGVFLWKKQWQLISVTVWRNLWPYSSTSYIMHDMLFSFAAFIWYFLYYWTFLSAWINIPSTQIYISITFPFYHMYSLSMQKKNRKGGYLHLICVLIQVINISQFHFLNL